MAKLLINYKADVNARDKTDNSPIHHAVQNADLQMMRLLLDNGTESENDPRLLCSAIGSKCKQSIELLLQHGMDVNCRNEFGMTALHLCVHDCVNYEIPELKLEEDTDIDLRTDTNVIGLREAVYDSYSLYAINSLLKYNADVNCVDGNGATPLHYSAKNGTEQISELLVKRGANVNAKQNDGSTPLHLAAREGNMGIVQILLNSGADIDCADSKGNTALHETVSLRRLEVVKFLLDHDADVDSRNEHGETPLHLSAINYNDDVCRLLLASGANVNSTGRDGSTPLHRAVKKGVVSIIRILVDFGADVDYRDQCGNTALHLAAERGEYDAVLILLRHDSDINIVNDKNFTPFHYAMHSNNAIYNAFVEHIVKMRSADLYLSTSILSVFNPAIPNPYLVDACKEELERMRKMKITNTISLRDILTRNRRQLVQYARNKDIAQYLKLDGYKAEFPLYADMISNRFKWGVGRITLLEEAVQASHGFFHVFLGSRTLPQICIEHILGFLSNDELSIFIDVCTNVNYIY